MKLFLFLLSIVALLIASVASDNLDCTNDSRETLVSSGIGGKGGKGFSKSAKGGSTKGSKGASTKGSNGNVSKSSKGSKGSITKGSKGTTTKGSNGRMLKAKGDTSKGSKGASTKGAKGISTKGASPKGSKGLSKSSKGGNDDSCYSKSAKGTTIVTNSKGSKGDTSTSKGSKGTSTKGSKGTSTKGSKGAKGASAKGSTGSKGSMLKTKGDSSKSSKGVSTKGSKGNSTKGSKGTSTKGSKGTSTKGSKGSSSKGSTCDWGSILDIDTQDSLVDIKKVASDGETVTFQVTQGFSSSTVPGFAVLFDSSSDESTCDVTNEVSVDWVSQEYTAFCNACGFAEVTIFLYLCEQPSTEGEYCALSDNTVEYYEFTYELDCKETCSPTSAPISLPPPPPPPPPALPPTLPPSGSQGDPHFKTWSNEHYEYHGQCDLVLTKDATFADGLGLDIQIRTKLVRFWSYIKSAAIRLGDDIFEVQGGIQEEPIYWINLERNGPLTTIGGFPVILVSVVPGRKSTYEIDLSSKFPGQKIVISTFKEFVKVDVQNPSVEAFGNTVGLLGDYKTGRTLARDGATVLDNFRMLGNEWQVLPFEQMLFHSTEKPQFPQRCIEPEDARGIKRRRRRLGESTITTEDAEKACSQLANPLDRKDCVYDILATQDLEMVGAF